MGAIAHPEDDKWRPRGGDGRLPRLAARQHGLVTVRQLNAIGFSRAAIEARVAAGRLHRIHRGVYASGHRGLSFAARCLAAVMAVGRGAALSHLAAAALWRLLPEPREPFDVTTAKRSVHGTVGVRTHRRRQLPQTTRHRGVSVTTVPQTLLDLAATRPRHELERAIREGPRPLAGAARSADRVRHPRQRTAWRFCAARGPRPGGPHSQRVRAQVPRPLPALAHPAAAGQRARRRAVGRLLLARSSPGSGNRRVRTHATRDGFEHDRRLDAALARAGVRVQRFSWRQLTERPGEVVDTLQALLKAGRPPADGRTDA